MTPELTVWVDKIELNEGYNNDPTGYDIYNVKLVGEDGVCLLKLGVGPDAKNRVQIANRLEALASMISNGGVRETPLPTGISPPPLIDDDVPF